MNRRLCELFTADNNVRFTFDDFEEMWNIDSKQFCQIVFYLRSHRTKILESDNGDLYELIGPGYKNTFYNVLIWMSLHKLRHLVSLLPYIPDYGCWKDLLVLIGTPAESAVINLFTSQLVKDYVSYSKGGYISMAAKWVPNENGSHDRQYGTFGKLAKRLGITKKTLRKQYVVPLRQYLGVTEQLTSAKLWTKVDYNVVPKLALNAHNNEFLNRDTIRYNMFRNFIHIPYDQTLYIPMKRQHDTTITKCLVVIDVAPSMLGLPLLVAKNLAQRMPWLPYRLETEFVFDLNVPLKTGEPDIEREKCEKYNLVDAVMIAKNHGIEHLIIVSNMLLDDAEYVVERDKVHITYWAVSKNRLTIESYPKYTVIDGYDVNIFNMIKNGAVVTKEEYINKIYEMIKTENDLPIVS